MGREVFISYSSHDRDLAYAACRRLEIDGYRCWIAPRDILPGQDYGAAIVAGIRGARIFLLVFSSGSNDSSQVKREVERAVAANLPIVTFRVEDVTPSLALEYFISGAQWLDAFDPPVERHLGYLAEVVGSMLSGTSPPASGVQAPVRASESPKASVSSGWPLGAAFAAVALLLAAGLGAWMLTSVRERAEAPQVERQGITIFTRRAVPLPNARQLRLRAAPSESAPVVALVAPDEVFRVAPRNGDWWPARLRNGDEGFVSHRWIRVIDEEAGGLP